VQLVPFEGQGSYGKKQEKQEPTAGKYQSFSPCAGSGRRCTRVCRSDEAWDQETGCGSKPQPA
jgi:hypothetical protein